MDFSMLGFTISELMGMLLVLIVFTVELIHDRLKRSGRKEEKIKPLLPKLQALFCFIAAVLYFLKVDYLSSPQWSVWLALIQIGLYVWMFFVFSFGLYEVIKRLIKKLKNSGKEP
jgi:UDP-N-acetylmuramyl pentapeptide phosphotransferase/UDP-N-acetylglucosamine-1-phosphate transferase